MTKTLSVNEISIQTVITSAKNGEEIVLEENGKPITKINADYCARRNQT